MRQCLRAESRQRQEVEGRTEDTTLWPYVCVCTCRLCQVMSSSEEQSGVSGSVNMYCMEWAKRGSGGESTGHTHVHVHV